MSDTSALLYIIIAWIILKKSFFGSHNDVYLANIHIVPDGSTYLKHDEFDLLYEEMLKVPDNSEVLLCGDYNARAGVKLEFDVHFSGCNGHAPVIRYSSE